jgi:hypothetical protein
VQDKRLGSRRLPVLCYSPHLNAVRVTRCRFSSSLAFPPSTSLPHTSTTHTMARDDKQKAFRKAPYEYVFLAIAAEARLTQRYDLFIGNPRRTRRSRMSKAELPRGRTTTRGITDNCAFASSMAILSTI